MARDYSDRNRYSLHSVGAPDTRPTAGVRSRMFSHSEAAHVSQWSLGGGGEAEAYQVESDTYRALGITGPTMNDVKERFPGRISEELIIAKTQAFEDHKVRNPAWRRN